MPTDDATAKKIDEIWKFMRDVATQANRSVSNQNQQPTSGVTPPTEASIPPTTGIYTPTKGVNLPSSTATDANGRAMQQMAKDFTAGINSLKQVFSQFNTKVSDLQKTMDKLSQSVSASSGKGATNPTPSSPPAPPRPPPPNPQTPQSGNVGFLTQFMHGNRLAQLGQTYSTPSAAQQYGYQQRIMSHGGIVGHAAQAYRFGAGVGPAIKTFAGGGGAAAAGQAYGAASASGAAFSGAGGAIGGVTIVAMLADKIFGVSSALMKVYSAMPGPQKALGSLADSIPRTIEMTGQMNAYGRRMGYGPDAVQAYRTTRENMVPYGLSSSEVQQYGGQIQRGQATFGTRTQVRQQIEGQMMSAASYARTYGLDKGELIQQGIEQHNMGIDSRQLNQSAALAMARSGADTGSGTQFNTNLQQLLLQQQQTSVTGASQNQANTMGFMQSAYSSNNPAAIQATMSVAQDAQAQASQGGSTLNNSLFSYYSKKGQDYGTASISASKASQGDIYKAMMESSPNLGNASTTQKVIALQTFHLDKNLEGGLSYIDAQKNVQEASPEDQKRIQELQGKFAPESIPGASTPLMMNAIANTTQGKQDVYNRLKSEKAGQDILAQRGITDASGVQDAAELLGAFGTNTGGKVDLSTLQGDAADKKGILDSSKENTTEEASIGTIQDKWNQAMEGEITAINNAKGALEGFTGAVSDIVSNSSNIPGTKTQKINGDDIPVIGGFEKYIDRPTTNWLNDHTPHLGFATGTSSSPPGMHWVGEKGPELESGGGGSAIYTHGQSLSMGTQYASEETMKQMLSVLQEILRIDQKQDPSNIAFSTPGSFNLARTDNPAATGGFVGPVPNPGTIAGYPSSGGSGPSGGNDTTVSSNPASGGTNIPDGNDTSQDNQDATAPSSAPATGGLPSPKGTGNPNVTRFSPIIQKYAKQYGVPASVIAALIDEESGGNPTAINRSDPEGSYGLMQLNQYWHKTDSDVDWNKIKGGDPDAQIKKGTSMISDSIKYFKSKGMNDNDALINALGATWGGNGNPQNKTGQNDNGGTSLGGNTQNLYKNFVAQYRNLDDPNASDNQGAPIVPPTSSSTVTSPTSGGRPVTLTPDSSGKISGVDVAKNALTMKGQRADNFRIDTGDTGGGSWLNWCLGFVAATLEKSGGSTKGLRGQGSAKDAFYTNQSRFDKNNGTPPAGAVVLMPGGPAGHALLSLGGGKTIATDDGFGTKVGVHESDWEDVKKAGGRWFMPDNVSADGTPSSAPAKSTGTPTSGPGGPGTVRSDGSTVPAPPPLTPQQRLEKNIADIKAQNDEDAGIAQDFTNPASVRNAADKRIKGREEDLTGLQAVYNSQFGTQKSVSSGKINPYQGEGGPGVRPENLGLYAIPTDAKEERRLSDLRGEQVAGWLTSGVGPDGKPLTDSQRWGYQDETAQRAVRTGVLNAYIDHPNDNTRTGPTRDDGTTQDQESRRLENATVGADEWRARKEASSGSGRDDGTTQDQQARAAAAGPNYSTLPLDVQVRVANAKTEGEKADIINAAVSGDTAYRNSQRPEVTASYFNKNGNIGAIENSSVIPSGGYVDVEGGQQRPGVDFPNMGSETNTLYSRLSTGESLPYTGTGISVNDDDNPDAPKTPAQRALAQKNKDDLAAAQTKRDLGKIGGWFGNQFDRIGTSANDMIHGPGDVWAKINTPFKDGQSVSAGSIRYNEVGEPIDPSGNVYQATHGNGVGFNPDDIQSLVQGKKDGDFGNAEWRDLIKTLPQSMQKAVADGIRDGVGDGLPVKSPDGNNGGGAYNGPYPQAGASGWTPSVYWGSGWRGATTGATTGGGGGGASAPVHQTPVGSSAYSTNDQTGEVTQQWFGPGKAS